MFCRFFILYLWAKLKKIAFSGPGLNAIKVDKIFVDIIKYAKQNRFGAAVGLLQKESPDAFESTSAKTTCPEKMRSLAEHKLLGNLRLCVDEKLISRIDGCLEKAEVLVDAKHPIILPGTHLFTRLIVLNKHADSGHAGPTYTLMKTRLRFWIIFGISSIRSFLSDCSQCARRKAIPIVILWPICLRVEVPLVTNLSSFVGLITLGLTYAVRDVVTVKLGACFLRACARVLFMLK